MEIKKITTFLTAIIFLFLITSCEKQNNQSSPGISSAVAESSSLPEVSSIMLKPENYSISFMMDYYDPYYTMMFEGCEKAAEELKEQEINIDLSLDEKDHPEEAYANLFEKMISQNKDALLTLERGFHPEILQKAKDMDIKLISVDSYGYKNENKSFFLTVDIFLTIIMMEYLQEKRC